MLPLIVPINKMKLAVTVACVTVLSKQPFASYFMCLSVWIDVFLGFKFDCIIQTGYKILSQTNWMVNL